MATPVVSPDTAPVSEAELWHLGLKISKAVQRRSVDFADAVERVLQAAEASHSVPGAAIELQKSGEHAFYSAFGHLGEGNEYVFAEHTFRAHRVRIWLLSPGHDHPATLTLTAEFIAQQLSLAAYRDSLQNENGALKNLVEGNKEDLALRKLLERAKTLLVSRGAATRERAEEFLAASAEKSGKPITRVAQEVILIFGAPDQSRSNHGPRYRRFRRHNGRPRSQSRYAGFKTAAQS